MARKKGGGRGLLLAGLAAGAYAYFKKPGNREKATVAFNDVKAKVNEYMESQNLDQDNKQDQKSEGLDKTDLQENKMTSEGGTQATVQYYNEKEQKEQKEQREENDDFKLSSNDDSEEKSEHTKSISTEPRLNTDKL